VWCGRAVLASKTRSTLLACPPSSCVPNPSDCVHRTSRQQQQQQHSTHTHAGNQPPPRTPARTSALMAKGASASQASAMVARGGRAATGAPAGAGQVVRRRPGGAGHTILNRPSSKLPAGRWGRACGRQPRASALTRLVSCPVCPCVPAARAGGSGGRNLKDSVLNFYSDDSPGIKIPPVSALVSCWVR
jgi:hypothetical protein